MATNSPWTDILTAEELETKYAATAKLDAAFAARSKAFWEIQSVAALRGLRAGAWTANDAEGYRMASSYLALRGA
jgi:hypothetical protein